MESENPNFVDGESGGSDENCELLSHETLHKLIKEIEQVTRRFMTIIVL